ncbi:hypothetical protein DFH07DRAFT_782938 [Mycena maculata]|uniref:Uncharacterized protein n=1 Tax=Mycena maculata TaxID=230809 RepID=A0AAD7HRC9_9AGAR|nr:hypothetical protein DFH07DRAFT_782938 [Mycena maculata]
MAKRPLLVLHHFAETAPAVSRTLGAGTMNMPSEYKPRLETTRRRALQCATGELVWHIENLDTSGFGDQEKGWRAVPIHGLDGVDPFTRTSLRDNTSMRLTLQRHAINAQLPNFRDIILGEVSDPFYVSSYVSPIYILSPNLSPNFDPQLCAKLEHKIGRDTKLDVESRMRTSNFDPNFDPNLMPYFG